MKAEFTEYLQSIGITAEVLLRRVEKLHDTAVSLAGNEFDWIFVDDYVDDEGVRHYEILRLLSEDGLGVAVARFTEEPRFALAKTVPLVALSIRVKDFDFREASEKSRLTIVGVAAGEPSAEIEYKASGTNCETLHDLFERFLKPRLVER